MITSMLIIDVGGANLAVEVQTSGFVRTYDQSGISVRRMMGGNTTAVRTFSPRVMLQGTLTKALTTNELVALRAAAKWPRKIVVGGDALRIDDANTVGQTLNARVQVSDEDFLAVGGTDFLHIAHVTVTQAD